MSNQKKIISFQGTLMLARELFKQCDCPLERRIIKVLNALTNRDSPCQMVISIQGTLKKRWLGEHGEYRGILKMCRMEEKASRKPGNVEICLGFVKTQDIYGETFYVKP